MKNKILISITIIAAIGLFLSIFTLDAMPDTAFRVGLICGAWLLLFEYANKERLNHE